MHYRNVTLSTRVSAAHKAEYVRLAAKYNVSVSEWALTLIEHHKNDYGTIGEPTPKEMKLERALELKNKEKEIGKSYFKTNSEKVIDISITPNRADCLGVRGIARDLASSGLGSLLKLKKKNLKQKLSQPLRVSISKEKNQGCLSFGSCYIKNITNKESPEWLKNKIIALGLKPISAVVDITNYVMFDLNRPLHAYDANKIDKEIIVRNSKEGESFEALDNKKYKLKSGMCVIADKNSILGLGGIIGGTKTSTELETKNILLESLFFTIIN